MVSPMRLLIHLFITFFLVATSFAKTPQGTALALTTEHDRNVKIWSAKLDRATLPAEQKKLMKVRPDSLAYAEAVMKAINPYLRQDWTVPHMAWLIRNHPQLTIYKKVKGSQTPQILDREYIFMQYFEKHHMRSQHAGEFVVSLLFRTNPLNHAQAKKLEIARQVYELHADTNKKVLGAAAFACGTLEQLGQLDGRTSRQALSYFKTAIQHAWDVKIGNKTVGELTGERLYIVNKLEVGRPVPLIEGFDAIGRRHALVENKGSAVLVFFWSQHMANFPEFAQGLNRMQLVNKDKKFKVIGVTLDDVQEVRKLIGEGTVLWKNFMDVKGAISKKFRVSQLPYCYLVDAKGEIVYRGGIGGPLFATKLSQLLPKK